MREREDRDFFLAAALARRTNRPSGEARYPPFSSTYSDGGADQLADDRPNLGADYSTQVNSENTSGILSTGSGDKPTNASAISAAGEVEKDNQLSKKREIEKFTAADYYRAYNPTRHLTQMAHWLLRRAFGADARAVFTIMRANFLNGYELDYNGYHISGTAPSQPMSCSVLPISTDVVAAQFVGTLIWLGNCPSRSYDEIATILVANPRRASFCIPDTWTLAIGEMDVEAMLNSHGIRTQPFTLVLPESWIVRNKFDSHWMIISKARIPRSAQEANALEEVSGAVRRGIVGCTCAAITIPALSCVT